jgi:glutamine synthetase
MSELRFKALQEVEKRSTERVFPPNEQISDFYSEDAFTLDKMKATLSPDVYKKFAQAIKKGSKIDAETADAVASAAKMWALGKGATHYTHWFQPLTGTTAEKHDSFFDAMSGIEKFKGSELAQQEPDASSFPHGGIRSTFEARGYTAWDPTSPLFIWGRTLCIPSVFVSYTGEALDYKAPLLKAMDAVGKAATKVCQYFDRNVTRVNASLGCEQEYFVVDKSLYNSRPDLVMCGRTVFGHNPARGQQLDDHYFGAIPSRIYNYMKDFEIEALKLGIPVSTRHNEVAPSQFEVAPLFEEVNVATDHNQLLMDVMNRVSARHNLKVLFHEKPFSGLNGNGKHNNWSLITNTGVNLFQPSSSARENLQFLIFLICSIKAVHDYNDLLRASIASAGNDHRLGANEAPPAIMSVFVGAELSTVLAELEKSGNIKLNKGENMYMKLGIDKIPEIILDNTDRNRTSPFAFTGNKFEFRAVGGSDNVAAPMTVLNLIVADVLTQFKKKTDGLIDKGDEKKIAIARVLREYTKGARPVMFEGDNYSEAWAKEAEKRGLSNIKNTPRALKAYQSKVARELFSKFGVLNDREIDARNEIRLENYIMKIQIESRIMGDLAYNHIMPTAVKYQNTLIRNAEGLKSLGMDNKEVKKAIDRISILISTVSTEVNNMNNERKRINSIEDTYDKAVAYCDDIKEKYFDKIRDAVDKLELLVDDKDWPLVKYREMLFLR